LSVNNAIAAGLDLDIMTFGDNGNIGTDEDAVSNRDRCAVMYSETIQSVSYLLFDVLELLKYYYASCYTCIAGTDASNLLNVRIRSIANRDVKSILKVEWWLDGGIFPDTP
jgi:hypothetical protein